MFKSREIILVILFSLVGSFSRVAANQPNFVALHAGQFQQIDQNLQVNVVFVGYHPGTGPRDIQENDLRSVLPQAYHETGHHLGLSHPQDSYDSELNLDYSRFQIPVAELGQESSTVMSYNRLNLDFSQFDRMLTQKFLAAAEQVNIPVEQQASPADYKAHGSNYIFTDDFTSGRRP